MADTEYTPTGDTRTDEQLMAAIAARDTSTSAAALLELRARYRHSMRAAAGKVLHVRGRGDEVDDAVQEAFAQVVEKAPAFRPSEGAVGGWLAAITRFAAVHVNDTHRSHHPERALRTVELTEAMVHAMPAVFAAPDPTEAAAVAQQAWDRRDAEQAVLTELVAGLPAPLRAAVELIYLQGLSRERAATVLGLSDTAVKTRIRRARKLLANAHTARQVHGAAHRAAEGEAAGPGVVGPTGTAAADRHPRRRPG